MAFIHQQMEHFSTFVENIGKLFQEFPKMLKHFAELFTLKATDDAVVSTKENFGGTLHTTTTAATTV
ncbi:PorH family porin [Corynebacterium caspium]|nr:PorH family porin [Corynebacterium caspium]